MSEEFEDLPAMEDQYELVMPFVCCASQGGAFDDHAFVSGMRFAQLSQRLEIGHPDALSSYESPDMVAQLELLAMRYGYVLEHEPWEGGEEGEWEFVRFCLPDFTTLQGEGSGAV